MFKRSRLRTRLRSGSLWENALASEAATDKNSVIAARIRRKSLGQAPSADPLASKGGNVQSGQEES